MNYQYTYLIWTAIFFLIWLTLYLWRKDFRKEMIFISVPFGFAGILSQIIYTQDWWRPLTITNTLIGIEDFFIGFFIGGIAAVIYEVIYKKKIRLRKKIDLRNLKLMYLCLTLAVILFGSFYLFKINSFYSSIIALVIPIGILLIRRKDLIINSFMSGILVLVIGTLVYLLLQILQPGFIKEFWYLDNNWYNSFFLGIPLREYVWYFLVGAFIGPLYEYWQEGRLINIKRK